MTVSSMGDGGMKLKLALVVLAPLGLLIPVSGVAAAAHSSGGSVTCEGVYGHWLPNFPDQHIEFTGCSVRGAHIYGTNTLDSITWHNGTTTTYTNTHGYQAPGPNACGPHDFIDVVSGTVTGGTTTHTEAGDTIAFTLCGTPYGNTNKLHQLPGSSISL
jgi:hypothetical protein